MAIKITCPNCKRGMLVPENMAGKKGRCKACQHILTVPKLAAANSPTAEAVKPAPPVPAKPQTPPPAPLPPMSRRKPPPCSPMSRNPPSRSRPSSSTLIAPSAMRPIHFPLDLAGKRAPCPECKNIIKVPEPVKKDPKDWRKVEMRGPSGARLPDQPEPEGAWGSTTVRGVGKESLEQAGVLPKSELPRTRWQKVRWPVLGVSLVLVLSIGGWMGYRWWGQRAADRRWSRGARLRRHAGSQAARTGRPVHRCRRVLSAQSRRARSITPRRGSQHSVRQGVDHVASASQGEERDAVLADLALALIELGGDKPETDQELRLPWDEIQKRCLATSAGNHRYGGASPGSPPGRSVALWNADKACACCR